MINHNIYISEIKSVLPSLILTLVLINLKLMGIISWNWVWILSPLWIPWVIVFLVLVLILIYFFLVCLFSIFK